MSTATALPIKEKTCPVAYSQRAEESVVGHLLYEPLKLPRVRMHLSPNAFFSPGARNIYEAMCRLADRGEPINVESVGLAVETWDIYAMVDAVSHCALSRGGFLRDLGIVMVDADVRQSAEVAL